jgi:hypothetical protein
MKNNLIKICTMFFIIKCQSSKDLSPVKACQFHLANKTRSLINLGLVDQKWENKHKYEYFDCLVNAMAQAHLSIEAAMNGCGPRDTYCYQKIAPMLAPDLRIISDVKDYITKFYAAKNGRPEDSFTKTLNSPKYNICRPFNLDKTGVAQGMICNNHALAAWQESKGSIFHNCYEIYKSGNSTAGCRASAERIGLEYQWTNNLPILKLEDGCDYLGGCPLHDFFKIRLT